MSPKVKSFSSQSAMAARLAIKEAKPADYTCVIAHSLTASSLPKKPASSL